MSESRDSVSILWGAGFDSTDATRADGCYFKGKGGENEMSEETLFEIDLSREKDKVLAIGIPLNVKLKDLKVYVNDVDINHVMIIESLRIVKVLK